MNWARLYAAFQIWFAVCVASMTGSAFWSFLLAGGVRWAFDIGEDSAMLFVWLPSFVVSTFWLASRIPADLRRAGLLSDEPESFGQWFR